MKLFSALAVCLVASPACALELDDFIDRLDSSLTFAGFENEARFRLSGTLDTEFYHFDQPAPALIDANVHNLFNPRLTLFLDAQFGSKIYFFGQARLDRHFDPSDHGADVRLDEYVLRFTPWDDGRFNLQAGKFATVVGNWVPRHLSWDNPFVDAPLIYENITAISDKAAPLSPLDFVHRFQNEKYEFNPAIWGPSYASGVSAFGRLGQFDYAAEMKNTSLSSRPESWTVTEIGFDQTTLNARIGYRPSEMWNFGISASDGAYFRPEAEQTLPRGRDLDDYRELVIGQDASFAWHHWQLWAEAYEVRFQVPRVGDADTFAYYLEAKYKFTPQFFGAVRWNQQIFDDIGDGRNGSLRWGNDLARIDLAAGYRFTSHTQLKVQYSFQQQTTGAGSENNLLAAQFTVRF